MCMWANYIFLESVHSRIGRSILGIYKFLAEIGTGNISFEFSVVCLSNAGLKNLMVLWHCPFIAADFSVFDSLWKRISFFHVQARVWASGRPHLCPRDWAQPRGHTWPTRMRGGGRGGRPVPNVQVLKLIGEVGQYLFYMKRKCKGVGFLFAHKGRFAIHLTKLQINSLMICRTGSLGTRANNMKLSTCSIQSMTAALRDIEVRV